MPKKGRKERISFKNPHYNRILLLVKIILASLGRIPFLPFYLFLFLFSKIHLLNLQFPTFHFAPTCRQTGLFTLHFLRQSRKRGRPKKFHLSKRTKISLILTGFLIFISAYTTFLLTAAYQLPTPTRLSSPQEPVTSEIYDRNGILLYRIYEGKNRTLVKLSDIPQHLIQATIAIEDESFYKHPGIDPKAILRALYHNLKTGGQEGASTITQQLVKNSLLTPEKSYIRKIKEAILAIWAEQTYSKDEILGMYFNEAPYGGSIVGIAAASQTYFGKPTSDLTLAESAYLAGLPASPTQFSPYGPNARLGKLRQRDILQKMVKEKYLTQYQADKAYMEPLNIRPLVNDIHAPHFVFYIRDLLAEKYGPKIVAQGGLKVYTTLDLKLQESIEQIIKEEVEGLALLNVQNAAAMVMDGKTGQILTMVGSRDYHYPGFGNFNATLSLRQPGSSIKPITYATAFKKGFSPASTILDTPVVFKDEWGNGYSPVNYDGRFHGPVTLRQALGNSLNIPAVKLLATVGLEPMAETAKDLGITTFDNPSRFGLSLTLGSAEVKMIEMMGVYGTFSQLGQYHKPTGILKVTDAGGNILDEYKNSPKQVISTAIAYLITNILADDNARKTAFGQKSLLYIPGYEVAVKTGTSDNKRDNWAFGYTPKFVVGAWVGNPDNSPMNPALASGITGATPIWNKIMHNLLDDTVPLSFNKPQAIAEGIIEGKKDLIITGNLPKAMVRVQKEDQRTIFTDPFSSYATSSAQAPSKEGFILNQAFTN